MPENIPTVADSRVDEAETHPLTVTEEPVMQNPAAELTPLVITPAEPKEPEPPQTESSEPVIPKAAKSAKLRVSRKQDNTE